VPEAEARLTLRLKLGTRNTKKNIKNSKNIRIVRNNLEYKENSGYIS
jgi:hypothetical protein